MQKNRDVAGYWEVVRFICVISINSFSGMLVKHWRMRRRSDNSRYLFDCFRRSAKASHQRYWHTKPVVCLAVAKIDIPRVHRADTVPHLRALTAATKFFTCPSSRSGTSALPSSSARFWRTRRNPSFLLHLRGTLEIQRLFRPINATIMRISTLLLSTIIMDAFTNHGKLRL